MTGGHEKLQQKLDAARGNVTPQLFEEMLSSYFVQNKRKLATLAGDLKTAQQILVALIQSASKVPKLFQCTPQSVFSCIMNSCATQLFPGPFQECAYTPFQNTKGNCLDATWVPMYQGLVKLAFNSGHLKGIQCEVVYQADDFDFSLGSDPYVAHKPFLGPMEDRGDRVCCYVSLETRYGRNIIVKPMHFIESIRLRSPSGKHKDSPWGSGNEDDYDAMARKTVLKQGLKFIPKSKQLALAVEIDNASERPDLAGEMVAFDMISATARMTEAVSDAEPPQSNAAAQKVIDHQPMQTADFGAREEREAEPVAASATRPAFRRPAPRASGGSSE